MPGWVIWQLLGSRVPTLAKRAAQRSAWHSDLLAAPSRAQVLGWGREPLRFGGISYLPNIHKTAHEV